jgi:hypothetical protein
MHDFRVELRSQCRTHLRLEAIKVIADAKAEAKALAEAEAKTETEAEVTA